MRPQSLTFSALGSVALLLTLYIGSPIRAQTSAYAPNPDTSKAERSERWLAMVAAMERRDFEYTAELAKMSDAPESEKLDTIVAVLTRLVERSDTGEPPQAVAPRKSAFPEFPNIPVDMGAAISEPAPSPSPRDEPQPLPPKAPSNLSVTLSASSSD